MIPAPFPDDNSERTDYEPAELRPWYGRKRTDLQPLTLAWFKAVTQPHSHDLDGTALRALTPPHNKSYDIKYVVMTVVIVLSGIIWAAYALGALGRSVR